VVCVCVIEFVMGLCVFCRYVLMCVVCVCFDVFLRVCGVCVCLCVCVELYVLLV